LTWNILLTPRAEDDLIEIWAYSCDQWGGAQADKYLDALGAGIDRLATKPKIGAQRDDVRKNYRVLHIKRHSIYYTLSGPRILIVRVLHSQMDPQRHL
jgi:toxin ParE1/3/4